MEKRIIDELNNSMEATWAYLVNVHSCLVGLSYYVNIGSYESSIEGLFKDFFLPELISNQWGACLSDNTHECLKTFYKSWMAFIKKTPYGESSFVFLDEEYKELVKNQLIPAIILLEQDISNLESEHSFKTKPLKSKPVMEIFNPAIQPEKEDLLWRVSNLYALLLKHKIIEKVTP